MGLGAIFGFGAKKKKAIDPNAPPPLAPPPSLVAPAPPDATLAASTAIGASVLAAKKVRRKIAGTGIVKPSSIATAATATPKSLIGY